MSKSLHCRAIKAKAIQPKKLNQIFTSTAETTSLASMPSVRTNQLYRYHYNGLGSTRALTNQNAILTDAYNYEAFGELLEQNGFII